MRVFAGVSLALGLLIVYAVVPHRRSVSLQFTLAFRQTQLILFWFNLMKRTREEVANTIEAFINGTGRQWDWDGFTSIRLDDPELEAIRQRCVSLPVEFPPSTKTDYCGEAGLQVMRNLVQGLRSTG